MPKKYNQIRAMLAITKASLKATFRSPQSIFFSLFFPVVLIWIFGSLSRGGGAPSVDVAFEKNTDSVNILYQKLRSDPSLHLADRKKDIEEELKKGRITAIIDVKKKQDSSAAPGNKPMFSVHLRTSSASQRELSTLYALLKKDIADVDAGIYPDRPTVATISQSVMKGGREYKMIDFFLPGMIGFSLIGAAVFGIAFSFYSMRETLVLKRMYSTPVNRQYIILGESLSKVIFQLMTVVVLIAFGHFVYGFTLAHGWITFINMLVLSFVALLVFMAFGFLITGIARNQNVIPIYANLFMFPQYFLSGTFFPKTALPAFLQPLLKFLPLTAVNDAMRNIAFEGASLLDNWSQLLILLVWGVIIYAVTTRIFRWE